MKVERFSENPSQLGKRYALLLVSCLFLTTTYANKLGDPAATLRIGEWIKGGPVTLADGKDKTVYVIEFWATWCPPCRESIPHLTELQAKFKDKGVVVIGITDESPKEAKPFVTKMGEKMKYAVGVDDKGQTAKAYMEAYRQEGIPTAFVIDKAGNVVWVGHPLEGLDKVIEQVVAGQFVPGAKVETAEAADEGDSLLDDYFEQAMRRGGKAAAAEIGEIILKEKAGDADALNLFAKAILTDTMLLQRDYPLALRVAQRAFEKTDGKDCPIVDTYARAMFMNGRTNEAIAMQQQAIGLCADPKTRLELKETLAGYRHPAPDPGPDAKPGSHIRILSHPTNAFNSLTEGILSRYFVCRANGKATTVLATTADFAVGSSGGPLFDDNGNVVGMVMSTSSVYSGPDDASGEEKTKEAGGDSGDNGELQMIMRVCIPSTDISRLITDAPSK